MKGFKIKAVVACFLCGGGFFFLLLLLLIGGVMANHNAGGSSNGIYMGNSLSPEVEAYREAVALEAEKYGILDYVNLLLAIMETESGGRVADVFQSSESLGLPPNTLNTEASIMQGVKYFAECLAAAQLHEMSVEAAIQSYNYGLNYMVWLLTHGGQYTREGAIAYAREKSGGIKVPYSDPIALAFAPEAWDGNGDGIADGWRYKYGNMFYVDKVLSYLVPVRMNEGTLGMVLAEAYQYQGYPYVFGGSSPQTSFDCSGLTAWCYKAAGISLPRTAQEQYDATYHIPIEQAQPGDLLFFQGTYATSNYITHVGFYIEPGKMYHAGNPIGFADYTSVYWQGHFVCAGRVRN